MPHSVLSFVWEAFTPWWTISSDVWARIVQIGWLKLGRNNHDGEKGFDDDRVRPIESTPTAVQKKENDYTTMYDGTKILRQNCFYRVSQAKGTYISAGFSGIVERLEDGSVIKSPWPNEEQSCKDIAMEAKIYQLLGPHDRLVPMLAHSQAGLVLEYMENGNVREYLREHHNITMDQRIQWAWEAAEGLELLHSHGIIHCDIKPRNFLLGADLSLKIADFSGSSVEGSASHACESTRYYLPREWRKPSNVATDLFALGSTIYEILTGNSPYEELPSHEVETLYQKKDFPDVSGLPCGCIIKKCWLCEFDSAQQVSDSIKACMLSANADCTLHLDD